MKLKYTEVGISYIENVDYWNFVIATLNADPICGDCLKPIANEKFVLIPLLNEVFCKKCAKERLKNMKWHGEDYEKDRAVHDARTKYWCRALRMNIKGGTIG